LGAPHMRTTQLVAHNGALQCNANRLRRPVNEGTRKVFTNAHNLICVVLISSDFCTVPSFVVQRMMLLNKSQGTHQCGHSRQASRLRRLNAVAVDFYVRRGA
jgi:hypothetical protein